MGGIIFAILALLLGLFGDVPAIAIFVAYFTMAQIFMHGLMMNKKMGTIYNPGVATALFVNVPIGVYALWFVATNQSVEAWCWWAPILAFPFVAFLTILLPIKRCQDKNTGHAFPKRDTEGFAIEGKSARLYR
ncbi:HXXEE domain-containing protein [Adlercreutzia sp. R21]|uniref:HXXEE domain-containing protein n=1 Tax=Adlercreutzia wanghongyangiae TaxID=3111451 RepID=UPI002DBF2310|nr:HXXEE domain-containing protein [Adlercreutzia sp. R21]MEC4184831.1 HXXEE domain-containing protein [Adlercreutzia sp. R21]